LKQKGEYQNTDTEIEGESWANDDDDDVPGLDMKDR
jgi:hypothetical protein